MIKVNKRYWLKIIGIMGMLGVCNLILLGNHIEILLIVIWIIISPILMILTCMLRIKLVIITHILRTTLLTKITNKRYKYT